MKNGIKLEEWVEVICPAVGSTIGQDFWSNLYYTVGSRRLVLIICTNVSSTGLEWPSTHQCTIQKIPFWDFMDGMKGHSEPAAINAPAGSSVHRMGCVFSFGARCGSSQSISFYCWPLHLVFFWFLTVFSLDLTSHSYPTDLPILISTPPTLVPYLLSPTDLPILVSIVSTLVPYLLFPTDLTSHIATLLTFLSS
jgi:hypothetical protein